MGESQSGISLVILARPTRLQIDDAMLIAKPCSFRAAPVIIQHFWVSEAPIGMLKRFLLSE